MLGREGTTSSKMKNLKNAVPTARKITKTDLAKYINAWEKLPYFVSLGSQKNFEKFMAKFSDQNEEPLVPDIAYYKKLIALAILYKVVQKMNRPAFQAFQANVTTYTISMISHLIGEKINLDKIWHSQTVSQQLKDQIEKWAIEVNEVLHKSASGKMISEWAKKPECWEAVRNTKYSSANSAIPELNT